MTIDIPTAMFVIALVTLVAGLLGLIIRGVWNLSRKLGNVEKCLRDDINKSRDEIEQQQDRHSREFGETVAAMREKIREVELFCRDTFVRRDSFYMVRDDLVTSMNSLGDKIEARLERMEKKIDDNLAAK